MPADIEVLPDHGAPLVPTAFATISVRSDCVAVEGLTTDASSRPPTLPKYAIYLGQANGTVVLYDVKLSDADPSGTWPIRVPADTVSPSGVPTDNCVNQAGP
jgi:hypothetical protein